MTTGINVERDPITSNEELLIYSYDLIYLVIAVSLFEVQLFRWLPLFPTDIFDILDKCHFLWQCCCHPSPLLNSHPVNVPRAFQPTLQLRPDFFFYYYFIPLKKSPSH